MGTAIFVQLQQPTWTETWDEVAAVPWVLRYHGQKRLLMKMALQREWKNDSLQAEDSYDEEGLSLPERDRSGAASNREVAQAASYHNHGLDTGAFLARVGARLKAAPWPVRSSLAEASI
jgi:hypothetical protein